MAQTSPSPEAQRLWQSVRRVSSLTAVCEAVSAASARGDSVHVERWATGWRWSPAHRGGAYPLLRIAMRFLGISQRGGFIAYETNRQRYAFVPPSRLSRSHPLATATLTPDGPLDAEQVRRRILAALPARGRRKRRR